MKRIAILVSGRGTNMTALHKATLDGRLEAEIGLVISNKPEAPALDYCIQNAIPFKVFKLRDYKDRMEHAKAMIEAIDEANCEVVVLAGYMLLVPPNFVDHYRFRLINIHPSLLPSFPGVDAIRQAYDHGVKVTGVSVIFVSHGCDDGEIVSQKPVEVEENDSLVTLEEKIHKLEHEMLWQSVKIVLEGRFKVVDGKVEIL